MGAGTRIIVIGTSGAGKTTLARKIAGAFSLSRAAGEGRGGGSTRRVIARSVYRAVFGREVWAGTGNREHWRDFMRPSHPIRWAWSTWRQRRRETEERLRRPEFAHLVVFRLRRPAEAERVLIGLQPGSAAIARQYP